MQHHALSFALRVLFFIYILRDKKIPSEEGTKGVPYEHGRGVSQKVRKEVSSGIKSMAEIH
jgi:hypothetical protein